MGLHTAWAFLTPYHCLDEEFDAPDLEADAALCRTIVAGKAGLHPDGWGNRDPLTLTLMPVRFRHPKPPREYYVAPIDRKWEEQHRQRPVEPSPIKRPRGRPPNPPPVFLYEPPPNVGHRGGEVRLTCDECQRAPYHQTVLYEPGERANAVATIRAMGAMEGWTCIANRDRCPQCSQLAAPEPVGNGAGEGNCHEQHTESGQ